MNRNIPGSEYSLPDDVIFFVVSGLVGLLLIVSMSVTALLVDNEPPLVAFGCVGTRGGGPIYAYSEDDLPECSSIERTN